LTVDTRTGVRLPRLRFGPVLLRGLLCGVATIPVGAVPALLVSRHGDRLTFLSVTGFVGWIVAGVGLAFGGFYWLCSRGDVRRWRDWRTLRGRYGGVSILGPTLVRVGGWGVTSGAGQILLYLAVSAAPYGGWLYGT
jgi:uncharacterized protein DUF6336